MRNSQGASARARPFVSHDFFAYGERNRASVSNVFSLTDIGVPVIVFPPQIRLSGLFTTRFIYIFDAEGSIPFFSGEKPRNFFIFKNFPNFETRENGGVLRKGRQKAKKRRGKYAGSPEKYCGRIYRKTQDKLTKKAERILAKKRRIKRGADILSAPRFSFSFQANFLPIRTPMTDAIMSPRVQPLESPRQWSPGIFVLKSVSILILLL